MKTRLKLRAAIAQPTKIHPDEKKEASRVNCRISTRINRLAKHFGLQME